MQSITTDKKNLAKLVTLNILQPQVLRMKVELKKGGNFENHLNFLALVSESETSVASLQIDGNTLSSCNIDDSGLWTMKTQNSGSQKIRIFIKFLI